MTGDSLFSHLKEGVLVYWNARTEQERKFLTVGGAVVALAVLYSLFIGPAVDGRAALRKQLPQLRQQAAQLQGMAAEAAELARQPVPQVTPMSRDSLTASMTTRGLKAESIILTGEFAKIQFKGMPFAAIVTWLDAQRREARVMVQDVNLVAAGDAGQVDGTLTLRQNAGGGQ
ncbi:type II secretion system protein M [Massilia arenosa]|uniref:Type II secretion system protein M n=1 Tax=Zemynaea arenosa TaxID=2561931 RepID=A0A4Y9SKV7_9BURK|nr:type II secretion system protein GspM [Massilia arenosa]TFW22153.1 type II secretion system protein M [Massilia arenosa]